MGFLQSWKNGGLTGRWGKTRCLLQEEEVGGKATRRGEGDRDTQEHHLCSGAAGYLSNETNPASQTLNFTEAEVTLMTGYCLLSPSLHFPGHQNC